MRCYNHPDHDALGICRNCGRGLCDGCIALAEEAVACKGACEAKVASLLRIEKAMSEQLGTIAKTYRSGSLVSGVVGLACMLPGALIVYSNPPNTAGWIAGMVCLAIGFTFVLSAFNSIRASRKYQQMSTDAQHQEPT